MTYPEEHSTKDALLEELAELISPLRSLDSGDAITGLVRRLGFDFPEAESFPVTFDLIADGVTGAQDALVELAEATTDETRNTAAAAVGSAVGQVVAGIVTLHDQVGGGPPDFEDFIEASGLALLLPRRLLDFIILRYLAERQPVVVKVLLFLGLVDFVDQEADEETHRIDTLVPTVCWERIPLLFSNPKRILDETYGWSDDFQAEKFLSRLVGVAVSLGAPIDKAKQNDALADALGRPEVPRTEYRVALLATGNPFGTVAAEVGFRLCDVPAAADGGTGIAAIPYALGGLQLEFEPSPGWKLTIQTALDLAIGLALVLRPPDVFRFETDLLGGPVVPSGKLGIAIRRRGAPNTEIIIVGEPGKTRLAFREFGVGVTGLLPPELIVSVDVVGLAVAVVPGDGDGFLQKLLPKEGIRAAADLGIDISTKTGFRFRDGAGFEVDLPLRLSLGGIIELKALWIRLAASDEGLRLALAVTAGLKIGPLAASVERIGIQMLLQEAAEGEAGSVGALDAKQGFKPPSGAGMSISAGPVTGGGYLFFDPDNEQYAGILQLSFQAIGLTAIGLLTTRLPDPSGPAGATKKGFSLLIIITVDLPPIQLGYGFTLNGVGGLLGINRTIVVDALRDGVRNRTVEAILFPQNPIARAPEIISALRAVFPPAEGRFVFGPMVKLGWGPNAIISLEVAIVLELMAPIRIIILGRVQIAVPDKKDPILNLRLDIVGVIDFDKGEVSVDASLVDSRLAVFVITGDMAVRIGWGASKIFAIAAGGFHPRFQPPPGFPQLRRLAIALADSDNPRIRMEKYFALTANSIQLGAGIDIYAKADTPFGTFSFAALANFDALIQFQPFSLIAELGASIEIARNGTPILLAALHATFSGPGPWRIVGYAEFNLLGSRRIDVDATIGQPLPAVPIIKPRAELIDEVVAAFSREDAWAALPPPDGARVVTLRDQPSAPDRVRVHPLGALSARQRILPLNKVIERFGPAEVEPTTFSLDGFSIGASVSADDPAEELYDDFAPGQFTPLTDDEKTARPAFESMQSGGRVAVSAFRVPTHPPTTAGIGYEESFVDAEPALLSRVATAMIGIPATLPSAAIAGLTQGGAAAHAATRVDGAAVFRGRAVAIGVKGERYVAASVDTLVADDASGNGTSAAEAYDVLRAQGGTSQGAPGQAALAHEAT
jgi:hypothetical protein